VTLIYDLDLKLHRYSCAWCREHFHRPFYIDLFSGKRKLQWNRQTDGQVDGMQRCKLLTRWDSRVECAERYRRETPHWLCLVRWSPIAAQEFEWNSAERSYCRRVDWTAPGRAPNRCSDRHRTTQYTFHTHQHVVHLYYLIYSHLHNFRFFCYVRYRSTGELFFSTR